jgi:hypothetical protein
LADKVRKIYELYGAPDRFALVETDGPHKDTPELRREAYRWMNHWLKGDDAEITEQERPRFPPAQLKVFDRLPDDAINATVHETFRQPARPLLPQARSEVGKWWPKQRQEWLQALEDKVFYGWPSHPPMLDVRPADEVKHDGLRLRSFDFTSEEGVELRLWLLTAESVDKPNLIILTAVDESGWRSWIQELGPAFRDALQLSAEPKLDEARFAQNRKLLTSRGWGFATIAPRGIGPTKWSNGGTSEDIHIRRRYPLLGQTLDGQRVWDVRRAVTALRSITDLKDASLWLQGKGEIAGIVLYAALFEPDVARLDLWYPPASHREGPTFLNVRTILDMPQAVALAFPKPIRLYVKEDREAKPWEWALQLQAALGQESLVIRRVSKESPSGGIE